ncbi:hypothetical protein [Streptomyces sp. URMC 124]|uniref:hypothetical protein n=1 Tax=Streptomyces sp. URMC 124 TaxID=3423405 RepID=UPI003F1D532D
MAAARRTASWQSGSESTAPGRPAAPAGCEAAWGAAWGAACGGPNSPSAARARATRADSTVESCRISLRLHARSASSHIVLRWTTSVPVASASASAAPSGGSSRPPR